MIRQEIGLRYRALIYTAIVRKAQNACRTATLIPGQTITLAERLSGKSKAKREQEDAQEFLGFLLDTANEELNLLKGAYGPTLNLQSNPLQPLTSKLQRICLSCRKFN